MNHSRRGADSKSPRLDRRRFLGLAAAGGGAMLWPAAWPAPAAWRTPIAAAQPPKRGVLVSLLLRGGADGLAICAPHADPHYASLRPTLALPEPGSTTGTVDLDGFFGLPPSMAPLEVAYRSGDLLFVHACGLPSSSRSHFEATRLVELGQSKGAPLPRTGWLGRHLAASRLPAAESPFRAVAMGWGLPLRLVGAPGARALPGPEHGLYAGRSSPATTALRGLHLEAYEPSGGANYPEGELGAALRSTAALIRSDTPIEAVTIDVGGWDTHEAQESRLSSQMANLARALAAFHRDLTADPPGEWALTAHSEFGRSAAENADGGTDHGTGGVLLAMGTGVRGGRVLADWPGLARDELIDGRDLAVTIDYRDAVREILEHLHGPVSPTDLFPDPAWSPRRVGVLRA